jgi:hypothetical protein
MARLTRRATVLLGCSLILAFVTACGIGSDPKPTESTASGSATTTRGPPHRVIRFSRGHIPNPGVDPQTADRHGSEGWLHPGASRAIVGAGTH